MMYQRAVLAVTAALLLTAQGCKKKEAVETDLPPANLSVITVHTATITDTLTVPAHLMADPTRTVHVFPPLSGRIVELKVIMGQEVKKGQMIALLQSGDVAASRADFAKSKVAASLADAARNRGKLLLDHEVLSQAAFLDLQATADAAHADLERARQRLHELGFSEAGTSDVAPITAPIAGTVIDMGTANGELQRSLETSTGIATIANLDSIWVVGDVFERDLALLHTSELVTVTVQAYPGQVFHGTLANVGDVFDPATHTLRARVVLVNPGHRLKPAMFANLQIQRPPTSVIAVPQSAVVHDGDSTVVYVQGPDGKFATRVVHVGASHDTTVEITSGLVDGERIVQTGAAFLRAPVGD